MSCCNNTSRLPSGPPGPAGPVGPAGNLEITDIEWAALVALQASGALVEGYYRITDYATTGNIPNDANTIPTLIEPLIVFALNNISLYHQAWSENFPQDIIHYELNDTSTQGAVVGRIYYRKNTLTNLSAGYDWRRWIFIRWETAVGSGIFTEFTDPLGGEAFQYFYTFGNSTSGANCFNIEIKPVSKGDIALYGAPTDELNNIIIDIDSFNNIFESNWDMNCGSNFINNHLQESINTINFIGATHVYNQYQCDIFLNATPAARLSYYNAASALTVVLPTA